MPRKKHSGPQGNTKAERATREALRDLKVSDERATRHQDSLRESFAELDLTTFKESKKAVEAARDKVMDREPREPVEVGELVEVEESTREELIKSYAYLIHYKMVYMVDPNHRLLILRFPNRRPDQPYDDLHGNKPLELRIKPKCGLVELDVPIDFTLTEENTEKAFKIQRAMMRSAVFLRGGSYGIAGGFGVNEEPAPTKKGKGKAKEADDGEPPDPDFGDWDNARSPDHFFKKITLSGMIQRYDDTKPRLMAGVFKGEVLHLSHVDAVVELTVSFQHLDALSDLEKTSARHQRNTREGREMERERQLALQQAEAKAVNVAVKSTEPEEGMPEGRSKIKEMLQELADEPWQRMKWVDHDDPESYRAFDEHFGLNKDTEHLPELVSTMTPRQYLDSISCPRYDHTLNRYRQMTFPTKGKSGNPKEFFVDEIGQVYEDIDDEEDTSGDEDEYDTDEEYGSEGDKYEGDKEDAEDAEDDSDDKEAETEYETDTSWETVSDDAHL